MVDSALKHQSDHAVMELSLARLSSGHTRAIGPSREAPPADGPVGPVRDRRRRREGGQAPWMRTCVRI